MSSDLIQEYRDTVFTEFNSELRPWRLYTTSIYHNPLLITDISYLPITSGFNAPANTLNIEASGSDINFYTNNNFTTNFNNGVTFSDSISIPGNLNLTGIMNISGDLFSDGNTSFKTFTFGNTGTQNTLPYGRGVSGQFLSTNGEGVVDWIDISGSTTPSTFGIIQPDKAVIVNDFRDISGFRNITIDGKFESKNYKFDIYGNVDGLGTVGAGDISSIGIIECASIKTDGTLTGPSTFIIDPAVHGDNTGIVVIKGSLHVDGSSLSMLDTLKLTENFVSVGKNTSATQAANSIVLNASGSTLNSTTRGLFINPIRNIADASALKSLYYNTTTNEIVEAVIPSRISNLDISDQNTNQNYNLVFTDGAGTGKTMFVNSLGITPSTINPNTGDIKIVDTMKILSIGTVSIGKNTSQTGQYDRAVSIGENCGVLNQGYDAVAIGSHNATSNQGRQSIAIGYECAFASQGIESIAIGKSAAHDFQGNYAIAIGESAGYNLQGQNSIAIGKNAAPSNQPNNSICINATGAVLNIADSGLYIDPIRNIADASALKSLYYNTTTREIVESAIPSRISTLDISDQNTNQNYNLVFAHGAGAGKTMFVDSVTLPSTINPNTGDMRIVDIMRLQSTGAVSIGKNTNQTNQGYYSVAMGYLAGNNTQGSSSIAVGQEAGLIGQKNSAIAIGTNAGYSDQNNYGIAIGDAAGKITQLADAVAVGRGAGNSNQGDNTIAIGTVAGNITQGSYSIAIGASAGRNQQHTSAIAIGINAGEEFQGNYSVAIGKRAAFSNQGINSIAIGNSAGETSQPANNICINATGSSLNPANTGLFIDPIRNIVDASALQTLYYDTVTREIYQSAIPTTFNISNSNISHTYNLVFADGAGAGKTMFVDSVTLPSTINPNTGDMRIVDIMRLQSTGAVSIGKNTNQTGQGVNAIAIGSSAGFSYQGEDSIALGKGAGHTNQPDNNICINATGSSLNPATTGLFIDPIRNIVDASGLQTLYYNTTTKEIYQSAIPTTFNISNSDISHTYNLVFADGAGAGKTMFVDSGTTPSTINPNTGDITIVDTLKISGIITNGAISIGKNSGKINKGSVAVSIGRYSGQTNQGGESIAIGSHSGLSNQGTGAISLGTAAGATTQGGYSIAIGASAGRNQQHTSAIAIGINAGEEFQGNYSVAIGKRAAFSNQGINSIAIGNSAGETSQPANNICINATGSSLNPANTGLFIDPIRNIVDASGLQTLYYNTTTKEIYQSAIPTTFNISNSDISHTYNLVFADGAGAGKTMFVDSGTTPSTINPNTGEMRIVDIMRLQSTGAISIGKNTNQSGQYVDAIAIGKDAGQTNQRGNAIGIGNQSGFLNQLANAIAIGEKAGQWGQKEGAVAIGKFSGNNTQSNSAIAIGTSAGNTGQGQYSIALGQNAGYLNQNDQSICINATGAVLNAANTGLFIDPIRNIADARALKSLYYDTTTKEIYESTIPGGTTVDTTDQNTNQNYNLVFADGAGTGKTMFVDDSSAPCTINPNTGDIYLAYTLKVINDKTSVGYQAGQNSQGTSACAFGDQAGNDNQDTDACAFGSYAGRIAQRSNTSAFGSYAGSTHQRAYASAFGSSAGQQSQGSYACAFGSLAGKHNQGDYACAFGDQTGVYNQGMYSVCIGSKAGSTTAVSKSIIINGSGNDLPSANSGLYIKPIRAESNVSALQSLYYNTTTGEIASGATPSGATPSGAGGSSTLDITDTDTNATYNFVFTNGAGTGKSLVVDASTTPCTINPNTGDINLVDTLKVFNDKTSVGKGAGGSQGTNACAFGTYSGRSSQGSFASAFGHNSGYTDQDIRACAFGSWAGYNNQGTYASAFGNEAGNNLQGIYACAFGDKAGYSAQGSFACAFGNNAGKTNQGNYSVCIGSNAGFTTAVTNSIIINGSGNDLSSTNSGLYIAPIRNVTSSTGLKSLYYNEITKEISYG